MVEGIYRLFDSIWRLSLVGSYCILLVILARFLLKKAPKWCSYLLWGIVFVRLCCPVLPGTRISLIPERLLTVGTATTSAQLTAGNSAGSVDNEGVYNGSHRGDKTVDAVLSGADNTGNLNAGTLEATGNREGSAPTLGQDGNVEGMNEIGDDGVGGIQAPGNVTNALDGGYPVDNRDNADDSLQTFRVLSIAWLLGMAGFMGYHAFSYLRMRNRIHRTDSGVRQVEPGICEIDGGHLSFVMGLMHPVIYLSSGLDPESRKVVLCHERVHLQRRDYLFKPAALLICCVHWFNPLVWLAFYLMNMDCEMSCDEKVVTVDQKFNSRSVLLIRLMAFQILDDTLAAHILHNLLGCIERPLIFVVLQQVFKDVSQHFGINADLVVIRIIFVNSEIIGIEEFKQLFEILLRKHGSAFINIILFE